MFSDLPAAPDRVGDLWDISMARRTGTMLDRPHRVAYVYRTPDTSTFRYRVANTVDSLNHADGDIGAAWYCDDELRALLRIVPVVIPAVYGPTIAPARGIHTSWHQELHKLKRKLWAEAHQYLERLAAPLRAKSLNVRTHVIAHDHPTTAILDAASSRGADVIAMTTRGQSGLKRLLFGSVADKVIRGATTPVLICPPVT